MIATGASVGNFALSFVSSVVLARLLVPADFGQAVLAITIADFLFLTVSLSLPTALLREPADSLDVALRTALSLTAGASLALAVFGAAIAIGVAAFGSRLTAVLLAAVLAARIPPLFALCLTADMQRRNAYGSYAATTYGSQALSVIPAIGLAWAGAGPWSLVGREVAAGLTLFALAIGLSHWKLRFGFDRSKSRELLQFGSRMQASRVGDILFHRYDNVVVGVVAGNGQLGFYNQAYVLGELGNRVFAPVIFQVPLSIYTQLQRDRERTALVYGVMMYAIVRAVLPIGIVMVLFPSELLGVLFGPRWKPAADMLRALSAYALLLPVFEHARVVLIANGDVRATLRARGAQLSIFIPATIALTLVLGATGAALSVAMSMCVGTAWMLREARQFARVTWSAWAPAVLAAVAGGVTGGFVGSFAHADVLRLVAGSGAAFAVYVCGLLALERGLLCQNARRALGYMRRER